MDRISGQNFALVGGLRMWQDRNLAANQEGTFGNAAWFNGVQEELMAIIAAGGETPDPNNNNQVLTALLSLFGYSIGADNSGYFSFATIDGQKLIMQFGQVTMPANLGTTSVNLPVSFNSQYLGGVVSDRTSYAFSWGVADVTLSNAVFYCPVVQVNSGTVQARSGQAFGSYLVWGI